MLVGLINTFSRFLFYIDKMLKCYFYMIAIVFLNKVFVFLSNFSQFKKIFIRFLKFCLRLDNIKDL